VAIDRSSTAEQADGVELDGYLSRATAGVE
jgi:hypothetical protein